VLIVLSTAYYQIVVKGTNNQYEKIGNNQAEIIKAYNQGVEYDFNAENSVKYASYIAINTFSENGGVLSNCYGKWKFNTDCEPNLEKNFIELFNLALKDYGYTAKDVKIEDNFLILNLDFNYNKEINNFKIKYTLPVTIKQELAFDMNKLNLLKDKIKECAKKGEDLNRCTNEKTNIRGDLITFTIENNKNINVYTDKLEIKKPDFIFKIETQNTGFITKVQV
jgi:hypothetical protein